MGNLKKIISPFSPDLWPLNVVGCWVTGGVSPGKQLSRHQIFVKACLQNKSIYLVVWKKLIVALTRAEFLSCRFYTSHLEEAATPKFSTERLFWNIYGKTPFWWKSFRLLVSNFTKKVHSITSFPNDFVKPLRTLPTDILSLFASTKKKLPGRQNKLIPSKQMHQSPINYWITLALLWVWTWYCLLDTEHKILGSRSLYASFFAFYR